MNRTGWDEALRRIEIERSACTGELDLRDLGLRSVPPALFDLQWLHKLDLGGTLRFPGPDTNWLTDLPPEIGRLGALRWLGLSFNHDIVDLRPLVALPDLQWLDLSRTGVSDLSALSGLSRLQTVDCSYTSVKDLEPLAGLRQLRQLQVSSTKVSKLRWVEGLRWLSFLDCSGTAVSELGPVAPLNELRLLNCASTPVSDLEPVRALVHLEELRCHHTRVSKLQPLSALVRLRTLMCGSSQVTSIAPLEELSALQHLEFACTSTHDLGPVADMMMLRHLDAEQTWVSDLEPVKRLTRLEVLRCAHTPLKSLDPLRHLRRLRVVDVSFTKVPDLGPIKRSTKLEELRCENTEVTDLGPLAGLTHLREVWAGACPLEDVPVALVRQLALESLCVSEIPGWPPEVTSGRHRSNCLPRLRPHVLDLEAGAEPLRTTKVIVLGNGRVGKTQLCRRLQGLDFDPSVSSTHGIVIETTDFGDGETLNLWDFGGQDIYHGAHALFMRTGAVFVIAWHPDFEKSGCHEHQGQRYRNRPLAYWLSFVRAMGAPESPVIIVQTQCDTRQGIEALPVPKRALKGLACEALNHSAKTGRGQKRLDAEVEQAIADLRARDGLASIGVGRARVIDRLTALRADDRNRPPAERRHRVLDRASFTAICAEVGDVSSPSALLHYLHQCGLLFYEPRHFAGRILLDLSWALDAIYAVFAPGRIRRQLHTTGGRFTREMLAATVWRDTSVDEQRLFLHLMLACGICFGHGEGRRGNEEAEYIAPDLLPERAAIEHHLQGRMAGTARRLVQHYTFLHPGLFRGLMAQVGGKAGKAGVYWRDGLWVYVPRSQTQVWVEAVPDTDSGPYGGRIEIAMIGEDVGLAGWLRQQLAEQSRRFGLMALDPAEDGLPRAGGRDREAEPGDLHDAPEPSVQTFGAMPPEAYSRADPHRHRVYISYARDDGSDQAAKGHRMSHALAERLRAHGVDVAIDEIGIRPGDRISAYVNRLVAGDFVFIVLGDRYLRSPWCMAELFGVWNHSRRNPQDFLRRVIPLVLDGTEISTTRSRVSYARYWKGRYRELLELFSEDPELLGQADTAEFHACGEYYRDVSDMLALLDDRLVPRSLELDALADADFAPLLELLRGTDLVE